MQTQLVFFDSQYNSTLGTKRSFIALPFITILFLILNISDPRSFWKYLLPILLIVSAIGVQLPQNNTQATVYGALVGFVVLGTSSSLYSDSFLEFLKDTSLGIIFCALASFLTFIISQHF